MIWSQKNKVKLWSGIIGAIASLAICIIFYFWFCELQPVYPRAMGLYLTTTTRVNLGRKYIDKYHELYGKYPGSLKILEEFIREKCMNEDLDLKRIYFEPGFIEYYSNPKGNTNEYKMLNGQGGWYYNRTTGELRVNLTKPVKAYIKFYNGGHKEEVPADWGDK